MTTILILGDIHADLAALERIRHRVRGLGNEWAPELALVTGDFAVAAGSWQQWGAIIESAIAEVFEELRRFSCPILFVPGNHDPPHLAGDGERLRSIDALGHHRAVEVGGLRFTGFGGSWHLGGFPYEWEDGEHLAARLDELLEPVGNMPEVLLTHVPPAGCGMGRLLSGEEVGSRVVRQLIQQREPVLNVCGHVHEANGWGVLGATYILNTGAISGVRRWRGDGLSNPREKGKPLYWGCFGSFHLLRLGRRGAPLTGLVGELSTDGWVLRRVAVEAGQVVLSSLPAPPT